MKKFTGRMAILGDIHMPFHNKKALKWAYQRIKELKPHIVLQIGDLYDAYSQSNFARSLDITMPANEYKRGRADAEEMWATIQRLAPKARCIQLVGNHDQRAAKRLLDKCPELAPFIDLKSPLKFEGVETQNAENDEIIIADIVAMHGYLAHGKHLTHNNMKTIRGHLHRGNVVYARRKNEIIWELDCGTLADLNAPVFDYRTQKRLCNWTLGLGVVDEHGPRFMPYGG